MQDIDYSHMTTELFSLPPLCPAFVLWLWNCVFNQSHPICMEISVWQLFSIQNKYTYVSESSLWGLCNFSVRNTTKCKPKFWPPSIKMSSLGSMSSRMRIHRLAKREGSDDEVHYGFFDGWEGSVWRAWRNLESLATAALTVSQTVKHNKRADVQSVWPHWSLQSSPSHLSRKCFSWNCLFSLCLWSEL